jgi:hypothetical protein
MLSVSLLVTILDTSMISFAARASAGTYRYKMQPSDGHSEYLLSGLLATY